MKKDNLIHIKLDYDEAIQSRKDVLNTEVDLIRIAQAIRKYRALRLKELQLKIELQKRLKESHLDINKTKHLLPKLQIPKILKKHEEELERQRTLAETEYQEEMASKKTEKKKPIKQEKKKEDEHMDTLEMQLKEIQAKLARLE